MTSDSLKKALAHLPAHVADSIAAGDETVKMTRGVARVASTRTSLVWYYYQGREIVSNDDVPNGYYGRWRACKVNFETMTQAKAYIDQLIAELVTKGG